MILLLREPGLPAKSFYNMTAHRYDLRQSNPWTEIVRKKELELLDKFAKGKILDVGCGNGFHLSYLVSKNGHNLFGADIAYKMLQKAPGNLACSSAENLPFLSDSFDAALCMFMVLNMCDYAVAINEIARVLRKGGRAILSVASIWDNYGKFTKNMRVENFRLNLSLFEKKGLEDAFEAAGLKAIYFDSLFRYPKLKPRWGDFAPLKEEQLQLLKEEEKQHPEVGAVYFLVAEKQ